MLIVSQSLRCNRCGEATTPGELVEQGWVNVAPVEWGVVPSTGLLDKTRVAPSGLVADLCPTCSGDLKSFLKGKDLG